MDHVKDASLLSYYFFLLGGGGGAAPRGCLSNERASRGFAEAGGVVCSQRAPKPLNSAMCLTLFITKGILSMIT